MTTRWRRFRTFASLLGLSLALTAGCVAPEGADEALAAGDEATAGDDAVALVDSAVVRIDLRWGKLPGQALNAPDRDWTGSFVASRGTLHVAEVADFENKDRIVGGVRNSVVAFCSTTSGDTDGFSLMLVDPEPGAPIVLTYFWQGFQMWSVTIDTFDGASALFNVGDGNGLTLFAVGAE